MLAVAGADALPQPVLASILAVCWAIDCSITLRVLVKGDTGGRGGPRSPLRWAGGRWGGGSSSLEVGGLSSSTGLIGEEGGEGRNSTSSGM